ncbi:glycerol-3-phosphate acyltransferase 3-like isoform X4 [Pyrgilauda ruficollis]|uniref:glycerol-3-phosphate acyltransferase 3-like isoform X4 n=1 Tax=Pyrgilauda ruficollis TaxID=221976 RepID=UPI001B861BBE|nr:glycerol-3-phosphate acyltransferase 3-like isoform X4 [Pyrgilauda ruficollis]
MEENREGHGLAEGKILSIWIILFVALILLPSIFRVSLGISHFYVKIVIKMLEWATLQIEEGVKKQKAMALENLISTGIIQRDETPMEKEVVGWCRGCFGLADVMYFSKKGCEAVAEDEVTHRFSSEELLSWNLLSRTNANLHHVSWKLAAVWVTGILIRYCLLLPFRVKGWLSNQVQMICATLGVRCLSGLVHFHNRENKPQEGGICVANHTSPLDVLILASDGCYSLVGQVHGGLMGLIQKSCMQTSQHVLFERSEMKDRHLVRKKIREHIADKAKLPILIFPEGTCINNTSVMMFKKGSFEVGGTIHPVAIKYDPRFGDAFWNSTKHSMMTYAFNVLTSWAIVCNVWYLPPMVKEEEEDAVHFANRVKAVIAARAGMSVLPWDGGLKRKKVKESFKEEQQKKYCQIVIENGSVGNRNVC